MAKASTLLVSAVFLLCTQLLHFKMALATNYIVGDDFGWNYNVEDWPIGKKFAPGDVLVFNYAPSQHNVVVVDKNSYDSCKAPPNAKVYQTGNDKIKLQKGTSYFICSFPGHCSGGMKIAVTAK